MTKDGSFRQDLYFRLNVVNLHIPAAVASATDDIPLLGLLLPEEIRRPDEKGSHRNFAGCHAMLKVYDFPGNVRELENIIERGVAINTGHVIEAGAPARRFAGIERRAPSGKRRGAFPPWRSRKRTYIRWVLKEAGGNQTLAAQMLGINRVSLWRKLKAYEMEEGNGS